MARLSWGSAGERFFETGIDRGVLYLPSQPGVPWIGLVAVNEQPNGGEAQPYYIDGIKYANVALAEEYEATLSALSAPAEFGPCDGVAQIHNGLLATHQPRVPFSLSYRTLVGNDLEGAQHGYKIHLVYNALAEPTQRVNVTQGKSAAPMALSWKLSTLPPSITGYKRTAHLVVDSRYTDPEVLAEVEDVLYGTDIEAPSIPTPDELIAIFA
jgi:hypothetical protein